MRSFLTGGTHVPGRHRKQRPLEQRGHQVLKSRSVLGRPLRAVGLRLAAALSIGALVLAAASLPAVALAPAVAAADCTLVGTSGNDVLTGTPGTDVLCGLGGNDVLRGERGDDLLRGGNGRDELRGGRGGDRLRGGDGDDLLLGGKGQDELRSSAGEDDLRGGTGRDQLFGGRQGDRLRAGDGDDDLFGEKGPDTVDGRDGAAFTDRLVCGLGKDTTFADTPDDVDPSCEGFPPNRAPTDLTLSGSTVAENRPAGTTVGTLAAVDPDAGDTHTFALVNGAGDADNGSFTIVGNQLRTAAVFDFEVKSSYTVRVRARDESGAAFQKALAISVTNVEENRAPTNIALSPATVAEDEPAGTAVGALAATDPDAGDSHTFALVAGTGDADNASFTISGGQLKTAQVFNFETKSSYAIRVATTDSAGATFAKALTVTVGDVNEAPTGLSLSNSTLAENEPVGTTVGDLSVVDVDAGQSHAFTLVAGAGDDDNGKFAIDGTTLETATVLDFEAQLSYSIRVRATDDGAPAVSVERAFTITVSDTIEPPVADSKSASTAEDTPVTVTLSASDQEGDDPLSFAKGDLPAHGSLGAIGSVTCSHATPNVCTADVLYTPDADYNGPDNFTYTASDGGATSSPATVSITVDPVNDAPVATPTSRTTAEDAQLTLGLATAVSDVETADADLSYEIVSAPAHGTATGTTYTPDPDFNGTDSLTYRVTDRGDPDNCSSAPCDGSLTSTTETVTITVTPVNDTPTASPGSRSTAEDTPVALNLPGLASDLETSDANLTYEIVSPPAHGTATATTYSPDADFNGTDSLTYRVTDRGDPDNCGAPGPACDAPETSTTETVSITVDPVNDAPVAASTIRTTPEDTPLTLDLATAVSDVETADGDLTYEIVSAPAHGAATATTYTPDPDFNGTDSLTYRVTDRGDPDNCGAPGPACDASKTSSTETVTITATPVNDAPQASDASRSTDEDTPVPLDLAALASDLETSDANLTYEIVTQPDHGTATATPTPRPPTSPAPTASLTGSLTAATRKTAARRTGVRPTGDVGHRDDHDHGRPGQRHAHGLPGIPHHGRGHPAVAEPRGHGQRHRDLRREPDLRDPRPAGARQRDRDDLHPGPGLQWRGQPDLPGHRSRRSGQLRRAGTGLRRAGDVEHRDGVDHRRPGQRRAAGEPDEPERGRGRPGRGRSGGAGERRGDLGREPDLRDRDRPGGRPFFRAAAARGPTPPARTSTARTASPTG